MSISANNTAPEDDDFAEVEFRPRPTQKEQAAEKSDSSAATTAPTEQADETHADTKTTPTEEQPADDKKKEKKSGKKASDKKKGCLSTGFDVLLVVVLLAILGGGGYYVKQQMELYRVPTPLELALKENAQLQQQRDELAEAYYRADEQLAMRQSLEHLDSEINRLRSESAAIESSIAEQKNNILAMQHSIRTEDSENRSIALSMLPGMAVGDVTTTRGRTFKNAYIYRMEGKLVTLRFPEGQVRIPVHELVKKGLPTMVTYALGEEELVDMSDFDTSGNVPAPAVPQTRIPEKKATEPDYEQRGGSPVVDTSSGTPMVAPLNLLPEGGRAWAAPSGDLPM